MKKKVLRIPEELHRKLKIKACERLKTLERFVVELLEKEIMEKRKT